MTNKWRQRNLTHEWLSLPSSRVLDLRTSEKVVERDRDGVNCEDDSCPGRLIGTSIFGEYLNSVTGYTKESIPGSSLVSPYADEALHAALTSRQAY